VAICGRCWWGRHRLPRLHPIEREREHRCIHALIHMCAGSIGGRDIMVDVVGGAEVAVPV
jgi:hypothetical protein